MQQDPEQGQGVNSPAPGARLRQNPADLIAFLLGIELLAVVTMVISAVDLTVGREDLMRLLLLTVVAIAFEEASRRVANLRLKVAGVSYFDMTSVWTFAAAIALPALLATVLVLILRLYMFHRYQRQTRNQPYRSVFTAATIVLACQTAHLLAKVVMHHKHTAAGPWLWLVTLMVALVGYRLVNALLIAAATYLSGRSSRTRSLPRLWDLLGSGDANALEVATLCLGAMVSVLLHRQAPLLILVLAPMVVLQRGALVAELTAAATTDAKTGLLNPGAWTQLAERELARAGRQGGTAAVLILDMDHFKNVNDEHGHIVGDAALRAAADALRAELRGYDTVGRFGGEEFVALLPEVDAGAAESTAERVRRRIANLKVTTAGVPTSIRLSASVGVACFPQHGTELTPLLHAADSALYAAKDLGRNRVILADGPATFSADPISELDDS
ncbi:MAG: diguanylate cyclase [Frankiales bacterium]|nr:diguanylate cyclase [Frankiales bacterium]